MHHFTHEAGILYLKLRTSLKEDWDILELRTSFLAHLVNTFGINVDPSAYDDIPLDGEIDLGGGHRIMAYVVNEQANQRVMTKRGHDGLTVTPMARASRLYEGGFRFVVGRAGIMSSDGRIPFGTTYAVQGLYLLKYSSAQDLEISFKSAGPILFIPWSTAVIYSYLFHKGLGEGKLYALSPVPEETDAGLLIGISGVLVFGNLGE